MGSVANTATIDINIVKGTKATMDVPTVFRISIYSLAPKYCPTIMDTPAPSPSITEFIKNIIGIESPTPAKANSPTKLPTIKASTVLYISCKTADSICGIESASNKLRGLP